MAVPGGHQDSGDKNWGEGMTRAAGVDGVSSRGRLAGCREGRHSSAGWRGRLRAVRRSSSARAAGDRSKGGGRRSTTSDVQGPDPADQNNLSDERTEFYLRDRLTWMRSSASGWATGAGCEHALDLPRGADQGRRDRAPVHRFDQSSGQGYLACPGNWSTRASSPRPSSATPRPRSRRREGRVPEDWQDQPAKLSQKDRERAGP